MFDIFIKGIVDRPVRHHHLLTIQKKTTKQLRGILRAILLLPFSKRVRL